MKKLKKAFTIVELVIVIAVIAILAAVLIPTFVNVTRNAKLSADEQAVYNMNILLKTDEAEHDAPSNLAEAKQALANGGYKTTLSPTLSGHAFYWNSQYNIVMLLKVEKGAWELVYPKTNEANEAYTAYIGTCYNLASDTTQKQDEILETVKAGGTVEVTTKDAFSEIIELSRNIGETFKGATVQLSNDIDFGGATIDPTYEFSGTLDGNGHTISNVKIVPQHGVAGNGYQYFETTEAIDSAAKVEKNKIAYGIVGALTNGGVVKNLTVTYSDTAAPAEPGSEYTYFGGIVGMLDGGTIENCSVSGNIHQYNRVGGIVGTALAGTIKDCTVSANITSDPVTKSTSGRTSSFTSYSYVGGIIGYTGNRVRNSTDLVTVTNCTVGGENAITLKASGWAGGAVTAWMAYNSSLTVTGTTVKNVTIDISGGTGDYYGLLVGSVQKTGVKLVLSNITLAGNNTVKKKGDQTGISYQASSASISPVWSGFYLTVSGNGSLVLVTKSNVIQDNEITYSDIKG